MGANVSARGLLLPHEPFAVAVVIGISISRKPAFRPILAAFLAIAFASTLPAASDALGIECGLPATDGVHLSTDGVVELKWADTGADSYRLEESVDSGPYALRYEGPDLASVRTGLAEGLHVFRIRASEESGGTGGWSEISVRVEYMNPTKVRWLLILGGSVVLATVAVIIHGHLHHGKEGEA